ncbi:MAG: hypothetical protein A2508_02510 [Candidatus Lambdaproteobacteria bacterium RIFOXYD12_FULL_49_8]|uniref:Outer membrane protein beta-barrel domain-containing protein n=1 Tax=Candidatus Lambdaproteobacteria bacterium RIFOXYD2_FULL_50_16 TaxID=1817772 RepID=A0A1F6G9W6_9PROT|nr:MAG: hypothetical protein A2527_10030 [Candidatus Lambdaproteobacteria bacterium RIFOXYD2_FULL_50_16]OGG97831.1 MAG: hypothetical protein A2508_02510 [Candidatus Lambdaproteobacteria bacterium RIFOXYD12_FULL_49_8]
MWKKLAFIGVCSLFWGVCLARAEAPDQWVIGGLVRAGGLSFDNLPPDFNQTNLAVVETAQQNTLFSHALAEHWPWEWGFYGYHFDRYLLSGKLAGIDQKMTLLTHQLVAGAAYPFLRERARLKLGGFLAYGQGDSNLETSYQSLTQQPSQPDDWSYHSKAHFWRAEFFFESQIPSGWGYRLGWFIWRGQMDQAWAGQTINLDSPFKISLTAIYRFNGL